MTLVWQYLQLDLNELPRGASEIDVLNRAGREGWELVTIRNEHAIFKRQAKATTPQQSTGTHTRSKERALTLENGHPDGATARAQSPTCKPYGRSERISSKAHARPFCSAGRPRRCAATCSARVASTWMRYRAWFCSTLAVA